MVQAGIAHVPGRGTINDLTVVENPRIGAWTRRDSEVAADIDLWCDASPGWGAPRPGRRIDVGRRAADAGDRPGVHVAPSAPAPRRAVPGPGPAGDRRVFDRLRDITDRTGTAVLLVDRTPTWPSTSPVGPTVLEAGEIVASGPAAQLQHDETVQKAYLGISDDVTDFLQVPVRRHRRRTIYAMLGLGLVVIYRSTGLLNFAQGEMAMFFDVHRVDRLGPGCALPLAVIAGMLGGFGVGASHLGAVRPVSDPHEAAGGRDGHHRPACSWASAPPPARVGHARPDLPPLFSNSGISVAVAIAWQKIGTVIVLAVLALGFYLLFQRTGLGLAMRASRPNSNRVAGQGARPQAPSCSGGVSPLRSAPWRGVHRTGPRPRFQRF